MPPSFLDCQLAALRRRIRRVLVTTGASWVAVVVLGALLAECLADWLFHFDDPIVRLILGLAITAGSTWIVRRRLLAPLSVALSDVDLALRIEDRFPGFHDELASSVQFLRADPHVGSPELQQAVVMSTQGRLQGLDCTDVVSTREVRRIAAIALGVCLITALVAGFNREASSIALQRLLMPFSAPAWPRQTNLRFLREDLTPLKFNDANAVRIAGGDALKLLVENASGRLPSRVTLECRTAPGKTTSEILRPTTMNQPWGARIEVAVGQLLAGKGDVEFRAVGGDDDQMAWHRLDVVPPPSIERLQVKLTPPAYTGRPASLLPEGVGHIEGLIGSHVEIVAFAPQPIERASLRVKEQQPRNVAISEAGRRLDASFVIGESGVHSWWFDLADAAGFENNDPPHFEVRGIEDTAPEVFIDLPAGDGQATPDAVIRLRTTARDDLGLDQLRLVYKVESGDHDGEQAIVLYQHPGATSAEGASTDAERPRQQTIEYRWRMADLNPAPGTRIVFRTEATDEFDLTPEYPQGKAPPRHVGRSALRTLTIASREGKSHEIAQRQEGLLADLDRAHKLEQQARQQIDELVVQLKTVAGIRAEDLDALQRTELGQREITAQIANPANGLARRALELLDELRNNQLDEPQTERRLKRIAGELDRLGREHLVPIDQELTEARKLLQSAGRKSAPVRKPSAKTEAQSTPEGDRPVELLGQIAQNQAAVVESIGEMLQDLSQWRGEHDAAAELSDMIRRQVELNERAAELSKKTLTRPPEELPPQDRADLGKISERQNKQAEQFEQLETRMRANHEALSDEDPSSAAVLQDAADQAREQAIAGRMREAADQIDGNRMGQAARTQQEVLGKLRELENVLRHNRESDSEMLVKKLKSAEQELSALRDRQAELLGKLRESRQGDNPAARAEQLETLARAQARLHEETARMSRRLARLEVHKARTSAERADRRMGEAHRDLEEDNPAGAERQQQEAVDDLEQAQRELAAERREAEESLAREQLAKIADELKALAPRQQAALDETRRLDSLHSASGQWNRAQLVSLRDLARSQRDLSEETDRIAERVAAAEVFSLALRGAHRIMEQAANRLGDRETGAETQKAQEAALRRLADLIDVLKPDQPEASDGRPEPQPQAGDSAGAGEGPPAEGIPSLAQLKLLISLQKELLSRTAELERLRGADGRLPENARDELEAIVREQGELADMFLSVAARTASESNSAAPDEPPDDRKPNAE